MKKLRLKDLKIESFVTSIDQEKTETVKGGGGTVKLLSDACKYRDNPDTMMECPDATAYC